jgi:16S rRNA (cytosine1402-N4)-methyltransferase
MHTPVLLQQTIEALEVKKGRKYIDATFGLGGHTKEILAAGGEVMGIEWDAQSLEQRRKEFTNSKVKLVRGNFADIAELATANQFQPVGGILFDLGLSMWQIRESGKGFSYDLDDEPLDMRISDASSITAADIITSYSEDQLYETFTQNAEELNSRAIAHALVQSRRIAPIHTVGQLKDVIEQVKKDNATTARIFQALRIEVNNEIENVTKGLDGALSILDSDGRIVMITFHPSEDRIVKGWIRSHASTVKAQKKAIRAKNGQRFERSALLRVITHA